MDLSTLTALGPDLANNAVTIGMGLALAATCGLRAFLPLLLINILALTGRVDLADSFAFMGTWQAFALFGSATVAEVAGDKVPGVDHFLDTFGVVIRPAAAAVAAASVITWFDPLTATAFGLIGGGLTAGAVLAVKAKVRMLTSATTAGLGNTMVSVGEDAVAVGTAGVALVAPILLTVVAVAILGVVLAWAALRRTEAAAPLAA